MRPKLAFQRRKAPLTRQKPRVKTASPCHGDDHFGIPLTPREPPRRTCKTARRFPRLLAPILRQGVPSLPAGTALHARSGPGLPRQAPGLVAPAFQLILVDIGAADACALGHCARPCRFPDGPLPPSSSP